MRKFLIPLLMASTMLPVAAQARDGSMFGGTRERAAQSSEERKSSEDRPQRIERAKRTERADRPVRVNRPERPIRAERADRTQRQPRLEQQTQVQSAQSVDQVRQQRRTDGTLLDGFRRIARDSDSRRVDTTRDRDGFDGLHERIVRDGDRVSRERWSSDWRRDHRYDWRSYRDRHRGLYRIGRYYDPYGWNYRRFSIGFNLWPSYYSSSYWLNDPWMYRLPPAYGPYRWVRYYDDALLVNIYTGQVVDVLYNFFW